MSLWDKAKSLIVETDNTSVPPPVAPSVAQPTWGQAPPREPMSSSGLVRQVIAAKPIPTIDPKIRTLLEKDINEAALPAFSEFTIASTAMADVIVDERTRFQAAMKTVIARGLTREQVLIDIDECLQALDKKEQENKDGADKAREQKVGVKTNKLASVNTELDALRDQIVSKELDRDRLQEEIEKETNSIEQTELAFTSTLSQYRQDLLDRKQKIQSLTGV